MYAIYVYTYYRYQLIDRRFDSHDIQLTWLTMTKKDGNSQRNPPLSIVGTEASYSYDDGSGVYTFFKENPSSFAILRLRAIVRFQSLNGWLGILYLLLLPRWGFYCPPRTFFFSKTHRIHDQELWLIIVDQSQRSKTTFQKEIVNPFCARLFAFNFG